MAARQKYTPEEREARRLAGRTRQDRWNDGVQQMRNTISEAKELAEQAKELENELETVEAELELNDGLASDEDKAATQKHIDELKQEIDDLIGNANGVLEGFSNTDIEDLKSEFESWRDGLPEMSQNGTTADLLNEVCDLDTDIQIPEGNTDDIDGFLSELESAESQIDDLDNAQLPRGYGRD